MREGGVLDVVRRGGVRLREVPEFAEGGGDGARGVVAAALGGEARGPCGAVGVAGTLGDLVADRIRGDAGVVAVAQDHRLDVARPPVGEPEVVVAGALGVRPHVERLVEQEHPELVARLQQRERGRVVRDAYRVEARLLQQARAAPFGRGERRRAEHAVVVVDAAAAELLGAAVDAEAVLRIERERADAEARRLLVEHGAALADDLEPQRVECAVAEVPEVRARDLERERAGRAAGAVGVADRHEAGLGPGDFGAGRVEDRRAERGRKHAVHRDARLDADERALGGDLGCRDERRARLDADRAAEPEEDVAVESRAGIPARGGLKAGGVDAELVRAARMDAGREIDEPRRVAVRMHREAAAVERHGGAQVGAVEVEDGVPFLRGDAQDARVAQVGRDEPAGIGGAGRGGVAREGDGAVVRQVDRLGRAAGAADRPALREEKTFHGRKSPLRGRH